MRIGELNYSGKATKLIAALMVFLFIFTLAIPAQPAEAVAATTVAVAAGLTLAFVAACGVAFTVNEAQNSSTYWEGQIEDYMSENSYGSVDEWADFSQVTYNSGILGFPGVIVDALLSFFNWFTGKNGIEAGGSSTIDTMITSIGGYSLGYWNSASDYQHGSIIVSPESNAETVEFEHEFPSYGLYTFKVVTEEKKTYGYVNDWQIFGFYGLPYGFSYMTVSFAYDASGNIGYIASSTYNTDSYPPYFYKFTNVSSYYGPGNISQAFSESSYSVTASDVIGLPDLEEKETELGYVPDVNIPLPEVIYEGSDAPTTVDDASTAVLDYAGTAGNILDLDYEYANTDTNVDTGTDTDTNDGTQEGTGTDVETGTQSGTLTLENVAADSLVDVAPETMLEDDTLLGLFISKFPWCIPFDLYYAIAAFAADPVAPEFEVNLFEGVSWEGLDLSGTEMTLSFEAFEKVAAVTRWSTLIVFCAGLAMITKRMIWS